MVVSFIGRYAPSRLIMYCYYLLIQEAVFSRDQKLEISSSLDTRGCIFRRGELGDIFNIEIRDQYILVTFVYSELA